MELAMPDYINQFFDPLTGYTGLPRINSSLAVTTEATNTGSAQTDLQSITLTGMTTQHFQGGLQATTNGIRIVAAGTFAGNGNTKTVLLVFGGTTIATLTGAINGGNWRIDAMVMSKTSASQTVNVMIQYGSTTPLASTMATVSPTVDTTASVIVKCTGQGTATADVTQTFLSVVSL